MPDGGLIIVEAQEVDPLRVSDMGVAQGRYVCLAVSDTGTGMDAETLAKAQEPFFTTKGVGKGTGLGLPMVQGVAEQSKGRFVLASEVGVGTRAEIWLPIAEQIDKAPESDNEDAAPALGTTPLSVLVVDDDPLVLENAVAMLEDLGHRVVQARSGQEALDLLNATSRLDLVITDQAMPEMTGLELLSRIRETRPELNAILATGYADLPSGAAPRVERLNKPFDQNALSNAIHSAVHGTAQVVSSQSDKPFAAAP
jgi:CheY-like chemotaxis protein